MIFSTIGSKCRAGVGLAGCLVLLAIQPAAAQSNSAALGFCRMGGYTSTGTYVGVLGSSDSFISMPLTRQPEFVGTIQSVAGNVITLAGTPGWTPNQFVYSAGTQIKTYYALLGANSGGPANPKQGCLYTVSANTATTLTLNLNGDTISAVPSNTAVTLIPYWTLGTVFPASNANVSFTPSPLPRSLETQIFIPNYAGKGTNVAPLSTYYFLSQGSNIGWRLVGDAPTTDHTNDILEPNGYMVVRNPSGTPTLPLVASGYSLMGNLATPLATLTTGSQDNFVSMLRPCDVSLNACGLTPTDGSFAATISVRSLQDQLFLYNNNVPALNKSASSTYYFMNNAWRLVGDSPAVDHGGDVISAGTGFVIRKVSTTTGNSAFWINTPTY